MFPSEPNLLAGTSPAWPYLPVLQRIALALALGLFVGLERERRGKEAGVRTFAFAAMTGCMGSLLGDAYAMAGIATIGLLIVFLNWQRLMTNRTGELTTSAALMVTTLIGVLCGKGHTFTPVAVGIATAGLLAWKEPLAGFSVGLTDVEVRSAILLGILTFVVYPVLPSHALDPWGLIEPRAAWATVILIAGIGFINYILWKLYGARGVEMTGFLGGLVNSTVAVTELSARCREGGELMHAIAYRGILLSTAAMLLRNGVLVAILAPPAVLVRSIVPLLLMFLVGAAFALARGTTETSSNTPALRLSSPFSLWAAFKFGFLFLALSVAGALSQRFLGQIGFYFVTLLGGLVSSASAVASAATLAAHSRIAASVAGNGVALASIASALINIPLVARVAQQPRLTRRVGTAIGLMAGAGLLGTIVQTFVLNALL